MNLIIGVMLYLGVITLPTSFAQSYLNPPSFHLIVSSYSSFEAASSFVEVLQQQGYQAYIVFPESGGSTYRVSIFGAADRNTVRTYQNQVKGRFEGWIFYQRGTPQTGGTPMVTSPPTQPMEPDNRRTLDPSQAPDGFMYYLILGSYDTYEAAQRKSNALRQNKYEPDILLPSVNNPQFRVYVYATGDRAEIQAYASRLAKINREAGWIYAQPLELMAFENGLAEPNATLRGPQSPQVRPPASSGPQPQLAGSAYYLIAASFKKLSQAQAFANELLLEGFAPLILSPAGNTSYYRVSVYHAPTRGEVQYYSDQLRKLQGRKYWILEP